MSKFPASLGLRRSEWLLVAYFAYLALIAPFFQDRPRLHYQPWIFLLLVTSLLLLLAKLEQTRLSRVISTVRDWLPILLTYIGFRETEFFLPAHFNGVHESQWIVQDHLLLSSWHLRAAIESLGSVFPFFLEVCYFLVYGVAAYCIATLYLNRRRDSVDLFFVVYLAGTLSCYALFPFFPSLPPRIVFAALDAPTFSSWLRKLNLFILSEASIHFAVFPSAHVSSAFSAAWAMFWLLPRRKWIGWALVFYAISVSIATIYGRYHYAVDVLAGFAISLVAYICIYPFLNRRQKRYSADRRRAQPTHRW